MNYGFIDTKIPTLGEPKIPSPIQPWGKDTDDQNFTSDTDRVLVDADFSSLDIEDKKKNDYPSFELAGPRAKIYFDPSKLRCALVACGGLCPGLNDVIRSVVLELFHGYGVENIYGIKYGLQGFIPKYGHDIIYLKPESVVDIVKTGGSILGFSRGPQDIEEIIDSMVRMNIGILFMIGGDGTLVAACKIADAIAERGLNIGVVGIPKTIDNDIYLISRSFGFYTAVEVATMAIRGAHNEAEGSPNGIGLVKLMGRHSGFIAATATIAQQDVNFVLIPEVDFDFKGPRGLFSALEKRMGNRGHAVIVVAEGAGQRFLEGNGKDFDESGNIRLGDVGIFLKDAITSYFEAKNIKITLKYIDPSYTIRSLPANASDRVFCGFLGRDAVHAGMAGKTKLIIGYRNGYFVHVPLSILTGRRSQVDPRGKLWFSALEVTGQGSLKND